jgi:AraC-like DNA-binding protein
MSLTRHDPPMLVRHRLGPQGQIERHYHDHHQLLYPTSGVVSVAAATGRWIVPPLRAIWLPAGCPHGHTAHGEVELCSVLIPTGPNRLDPDRPTLVSVSPLLREVLLALTALPAPRDDERTRLEAVVFDQLRPAPAAAAYHLVEPDDDRLRAIAQTLLADPGNPSTLAQLGRDIGSSERTLSRLFRSNTHMSFPQWRAQLRLQAALVDLASGMSVTDVSHRCGYSTPSAFIASFRHAFGETPGSYRHGRT